MGRNQAILPLKCRGGKQHATTTIIMFNIWKSSLCLLLVLCFVHKGNCDLINEANDSNYPSALNNSSHKEDEFLINTTFDGGGTAEEHKEEDEASDNKNNFWHGTCHALTYEDILQDISGNITRNRSLLSYVRDYNFTFEKNEKISKKIQCFPKNITENETLYGQVKLINSTFLFNKLNSLKNETSSINYCAIVMFYAPWCQFCAQAAPHYNALARVFPGIDVFALDAIAYNNLNFRFGTVAVPNIIIFHNSKPVARYNSSERTLQRFTSFVMNVTGLSPNTTELLPIDYEGPVKPTPDEGRDFFLWSSWAVVLIVCSVYIARSPITHSIWNALGSLLGYIEHAHID